MVIPMMRYMEMHRMNGKVAACSSELEVALLEFSLQMLAMIAIAGACCG